MSKLNRLFDLASKALDSKSSGSQGARPTGSSGSGGTDWRGMVRSAADALTGDNRQQSQPASGHQAPRAPQQYPRPAAGGAGAAGQLSPQDRQAIARYDYLVQTADPQQVERIHQDAFERLTPAQRAEVQSRMNADLPADERPRTAASHDLARAATRSEMMRPGSLRTLLGKVRGSGSSSGGRMGAGLAGAAAGGAAGFAAGGLLTAVAGGALLSTVAAPLLAEAANFGIDFDQLAEGIDLGQITGLDELGAGLTEGVAGFEDGVAGLGEGVSGIGEQLGDFRLGDLGDFFGR